MNFNWQRIKHIQKLHRVMYAIGLGPIIGRIILLLTTTGRKSGLKRVTPLQYERIGDTYYVGSARGKKADWYQNLLENPSVKVEIKGEQFPSRADPIQDVEEIADFFELRLRRHPRMIRAMLRMEGLAGDFTREELIAFAGEKAVVILHPSSQVNPINPGYNPEAL